MKNKSKKHEALKRQLLALFGDPATAETSEVEDLYEEMAGGSDIVQMAHERAAEAAQRYRLEGKAVPPHVQAALTQMKKATTLEGTPPAKLGEIVEWVLKPFLGPTDALAFNYHRLTDKSKKDDDLLKELGEEVKRDWTQEK